MSLSFFKPNKSNKGALLSVNFSAKADKLFAEESPILGTQTLKGDKSFYLNLVGQTSWNESERTGGFKDGKKIVIKLSPTEIGGILYAIQKNLTLAAAMGQEYVYHYG